MTSHYWKCASHLALEIEQRRLSPVQLVEDALKRILQWDPLIHAFVACDEIAVRRAALRAEEEIAGGCYRGPLHGIPVGIKDVIDVQGLPTTCCSKLRSNQEACADATVVERVRQAGAIILGKLTTHEFALGGPSFDLPFPPARNPWNLDHHPGGSSSGCGAALAAGLVGLAIGTDTAGSIRNPASACGVVGLKPTYGAVSRNGVFPLAVSLDHVGPMARSVDDIAMLFQGMVSFGWHPLRGWGSTQKSELVSLGEVPDIKGLRIGYVGSFHERDMPADTDVMSALDSVAAALEDAGCILKTVHLPNLNTFSLVSRIILQAEGWATHGRWLRQQPELYGKLTRQRLLPGAFLSAEDYVRAQRLRRHMLSAVQSVLEDVDVLLCANSMDPACRLDDQDEILRTYPRQARTPFNVTGHPAIAMMAGLSRKGLPVSVQFAGRYFDEVTVLRVAKAWEIIGGWQDRHPPMLARAVDLTSGLGS